LERDGLTGAQLSALRRIALLVAGEFVVVTADELEDLRKLGFIAHSDKEPFFSLTDEGRRVLTIQLP
jgi:hypothetical protein